ncbi:MAG: hypothetical protein ABI165_11890, partial [Bryobacteraceae bacterium]
GLWIRLRFRDAETLEGLLPNNLLLQEPYGFTFVPPDPTFQNQKIFTPRAALDEVQVLGVVGSPLKRSRSTKVLLEKLPDNQLKMFD